MAFTSCKSSESAYKKAYDKAKAEQSEPVAETPVEVNPMVVAPVEVKRNNNEGVRQEKVTYVSGNEEVNDYNVICGSFSLKANAEGLKDFLISEGYNATIVFNADTSSYRVIVDTFADRTSAERARDAFKAKYPNNADFQKSWLLYRLK